MPWNQIISMNIRPPRPIDPRNWARLPKANGRMRKRERRNIGSFTRLSMTANAASRTMPLAIMEMTNGLPHPEREVPYGSMP